jgi:hypothetical protein
VLQLGPLPPGKNPFAVQINNNNIIKSIMWSHCIAFISCPSHSEPNFWMAYIKCLCLKHSVELWPSGFCKWLIDLSSISGALLMRLCIMTYLFSGHAVTIIIKLYFCFNSIQFNSIQFIHVP